MTACRRLILLLVALIPLAASAQLFHVEQARREPLPFAAGMATTVAVHELGHVLVAKSRGFDVGLDGFSIVYPGAAMARGDHARVAAAGYQAQWLLAEGVLREAEARPGRRMDPYRAGIVAGHLVITAVYLAGLKDSRYSDVAGLAQATGADPNAIMAVLLIPAACDAYRLTGRRVPAWAPRLSAGAKGIGMAVVWTY